MIEAPNQLDWNLVLTDLGFVTISIPCEFTFEASPTAEDIHFTTNAQIYGKTGFSLYIRNFNPVSNKILSYAVTAG